MSRLVLAVVPIWKKLVAIDWMFFGSELALISLAWWQLGAAWGRERRRSSALIAMSLLTANVLFGFYERYTLERMAFLNGLKAQGNYDAVGWVLAIGALILALRWRRYSKEPPSGLAVGLGIWLCLSWSLAIGAS